MTNFTRYLTLTNTSINQTRKERRYTHVQSVHERRPIDRRLDPVGVDQLHFDVVGVNEDGRVRLNKLGQVSLQLGGKRGGFEG